MLLELTEPQLLARVPSAYAQHPCVEKVSTSYRMIPTSLVIEHLRKNGFVPVEAAQTHTRAPGREYFTRHVVKFYNLEKMPLIVGDVVPQICLSNSHDGTSRYKISMALKKLACLNGLMVNSANIDEISIRHSGPEELVRDVLLASFDVVRELPRVASQIEDWCTRKLSTEQQLSFAQIVLDRLYHTTCTLQAAQIIQVRREADREDSIWCVMNRIQENIVKGGLMLPKRENDKRHRSTYGIRALNNAMRFNKALWRLTENLATSNVFSSDS